MDCITPWYASHDALPPKFALRAEELLSNVAEEVNSSLIYG